MVIGQNATMSYLVRKIIDHLGMDCFLAV